MQCLFEYLLRADERWGVLDVWHVAGDARGVWCQACCGAEEGEGEEEEEGGWCEWGEYACGRGDAGAWVSEGLVVGIVLIWLRLQSRASRLRVQVTHYTNDLGVVNSKPAAVLVRGGYPPWLRNMKSRIAVEFSDANVPNED